MPPTYEKQLLEKIARQTEENNKILRGLRSDSRWAKFFGFIKWAIIIVPIIAAYYYLSPHWNDIQKLTTNLITQIQSIGGLNDQLKNLPQNLDGLIKNLPKTR